MPDQPTRFTCVGWFLNGVFCNAHSESPKVNLVDVALWAIYVAIPPDVHAVVLEPKSGKLWLVDFSKNLRHPQENEMYVSEYYEFPNLDAVRAAHAMMEA